jgi:uncharacterized membrane protein (UPF0127 family)
MYFIFENAKEADFWMKNMLIPIDIVWVADQKVIGIDQGIPPPAAGQSDEELPLYHSPGAIDAVLEVAAGEADRLSIDIGTSILLQ